MNTWYLLPTFVDAVCNKKMMNDSVRQLWKRFTLDAAELSLQACDEMIFRIGATILPELAAGDEYALRIDSLGAAVVGRDYGGLMRGFAVLLMQIEFDGLQPQLKHAELHGVYRIARRMIHICVFPENDLYFIKKLVRLAALCQYTHIVIEFWGMLRYDCLRELSWPHAFTKAEAAEIIRECRELGIEPVPMYNMLGHATASRVCYGKHVVLDQNPRLQPLFTPDGWAWNILSDDVVNLLRNVRAELYELFGDGEYFHIGCDEAYYITRDDELRAQLPGYLANLTREVEADGRKPLLWMDMLLEAGRYPKCVASGKAEEMDSLRGALAPSSIFVDWQYSCTEVPIPTLLALKDSGHDVIGAPWLDRQNYAAHIETITANDLSGIMLTTWHTLQEKMFGILGCAKGCGAATFPWSASSGLREETATLLRRVSFEGNSYADCGWSKAQIII